MSRSNNRHAPSWYAATCNSILEFPELKGEHQADICVLGGGFTGVNTAIELSQRGYSVILLEANRIGWGASGRNGGELIRGIGHGLDQFRHQIGDEGVHQLKLMGIEALEIVKQRITDHDIACDLTLGYSDLATRPRHMQALEEDFQELQALNYPHALKLVDKSGLKEEVVNSDFYLGGMIDEGSGHLHPLNLVLGEAAVAQSLGARLYENSAVTQIIKGDRPQVLTAAGRVTCDRLVMAANGYLPSQLEPWLGGKILPAGSYIVVTEPLGDDVCRQLMPRNMAVADLRIELDYYRITADKRLLFGGLCTYTGKDPKNIAAALQPNIRKVFPQLGDVRIDYQWGGMLGIGANRLPQIGQLPDCPSIYFAQAYAGHGLNASHLAAKVVGEAISGELDRFNLFARVPHMTFPGGDRLRSPLLATGMLWYKFKDLF